MTKTIYLIPGVGANHRIFQNLRFPDYEIVHIKWAAHRKNESLEAYVKKLLPQIKKDTQPILVGLSFGGIVAMELAKLIEPYKVILISSIKTYHERPLKMLFLNSLKFHRLLPGKLVVKFRFWTKWLFGELDKQDLELIDIMIDEANIEFNEWAVDQLINWKNEEVPDNVVHIHGTSDTVFPDFYIKNAIWVKGGSHLMIVNKAKEINKILARELGASKQHKIGAKRFLRRAS